MDDEDTEEEEEDSDDEFVIQDEPEEEEDEIEDDVFSDSKANDDEDSIFCPWAGQDPETLPKLELPESSADIPIARQHTMDAIEVYEILRSYHRTLRITPFTFEDFCAALISKNNSCIMAEVHMALLRVCLKSDDEEQTHYSVTDTNNAVNIMLHHMDTLTYAEILRQYIESYQLEDSSVRDAINVENYPYVGYEAKLVVLLFMSYRFLYSSEFKKVVNNAGKFQNDESCRVCGKSSGRVIGCSQCEAAFHVECSQVKPFPEVLVCFICKKNDVKGVLPLDESVDREPLRSQPIGRDRYGRLYWFLARRIFVQSLDETELHYYSTPPQLYQLLNALDRDYYERDLCEVIRQRIDELLEQMTLTLELTAEKREGAVEIVMKKNQWNYEYAEPTVQPLYLHKDSMKRMASILRDVANKSTKKDVKVEIEDSEDSTKREGEEDAKKEEDDEEETSPASKYEEDTILPESMLGICNGDLINTFWSGGITQDDLVTHYNYYQLQNLETNRLWRLGDVVNDESFMAYYNYYYKNDMAESFLTRKKQTDKKKYMASKFATIEAFDWVVAKDRLFYGNSMLHTKFVAWTLSKTARKIPADLMHRKWPEIVKLFDMEVANADDYKKLGKCLLELDAAARRTIFMPQWWNGLGQTRMERITQDQREQFTKEQQKVKKMELEAISKDLDDQWIRVNYSKPKWPNTYILRQKGETYRNAGKGQMGGWIWVAKKYQERRDPVPEHPQYPLPAEGAEEEEKLKYTANRKARRLNSLADRITEKRDAKTSQKYNGTTVQPPTEIAFKCYSPACQKIRQNVLCYSPDCRQHQRKMRALMMRAKIEADQTEEPEKGVLGEDRAWPIPEIQTFSSRGGGKSLFVLQKRILRRLIATAGCQSVYMPGFQANTKSNLLIWPYPSPRPALDLCWKWQTLNACNLHAIALQLRIMWSSIKWNEFEPDDNHPDRRFVIGMPNHDERRQIVRHKEMPPYGQYERYELEIEIIPLYEDQQEDEEESWLSRSSRQTDCSQKGASRVGRKAKRPRTIDNRTATAIRHEWVDGVTLKVFEIKDYWKNVRMEHERQVRRKLEAAKKAARAREDAERLRQISLQRIQTVQRTPSATSTSPAMLPTEKGNVPYMGRGNRQNTGYLERYNTTSQLPPCPPDVPLLTPGYIPQSHGPSPSSSIPTPSSSTSSSIQRVMPNPIRKVPVATVPRPSPQQYPQRVAAGQDYTGGYATTTTTTPSGTTSGAANRVQTGLLRSGPPPPRATYYSPAQRPQNHQQQRHPQQYTMPQYPTIQRSTYSNGQKVQNGGSRLIQDQYQQPQQRRVVVMPQVRPQIIEESYATDQHPQSTRYDQGAPPRPIYHGQQQQQRTVAPGTAIANSGAAKKFVYVRGPDGTPQQQRVVVRSAVDDYPPGTVLQGSSGPRYMPVRTNGGGATQIVRQVINPDGTTKYVRTVMGGGQQQMARRVVPVQQQQMVQQRQPFQDLMDHDQQHNNNSTPSTSAPIHPRFVIQHGPPQQQQQQQQRQRAPYPGTMPMAPKPRPPQQQQYLEHQQEQQMAPEYPEMVQEEEPMLQEQQE